MAEADSISWFEEGLKFTCTQCGNCCSGPSGYVWIDEGETEALAAHLGLSIKEFQKKHARKVFGRWTLDEVWRGKIHGHDCVFLKRDTETGKACCGVYESRPKQCRTWPFWPENLRSHSAWQRAASGCPGMNKQRLYTVDEIRICRDGTPKA